MQLKITSKIHLESILSIALNQYDDCVIEIKHTVSNQSVYITSSKLSEDTNLFSLCAASKSIGNVIRKDDKKAIRDWIQLNTYTLQDVENIVVDITIKQDQDNSIKDNNLDIDDIDYSDTYNIDPDGYDNIIDYREDYLTKHNRMRILQRPIRITKVEHAMSLFNLFLKKDNCNKIIFSFYIYIPDLDHIYVLDLILDKIYVYGRTYISFTSTRPDLEDIEYTCPADTVYEYYGKNYEEIAHEFFNYVMTCFYRCSVLSNEEIKINVYSNCKLIQKKGE